MAREMGRFIVFEGLDGCGKTTQLNLLSQRLAAARIPAITTREPSDGNILGMMARGAVKGMFSLENESLALLFAADRYEHAVKEILPYLNKGITVLCDRYYFSNFAYQGGHVLLWKLIQYNEPNMSLLKPDAVVFLDTPPGECSRRLKERPTRLELFESGDNLITVRRNYFKAFKALKETENILIIEPGELSAAVLAEQIWTRLAPVFNL